MTVFKLLLDSGLDYSKKDLVNIGPLCAAKARDMKVPFTKINQIEPAGKFKVFSYPESFIPIMEEIIINYFQRKIAA